MEEHTVSIIIEDPVQKEKKSLLSSVVVSLLSFGYGLAIGNSYFLTNYFCSEDINTNLETVTNSTLTSSQFKNNDLECVSANYQNVFNLLILIGALFSVYTHEYFKIKRSKKLGFTGLIYFVGFLLVAFIKKNIFVGLTGRFLVGIAIGLSNSLMIPFIVDNCSDNYVNLMKMITPINTTIGIVLSSLVSFLIAESGYEIVFCVYSAIYFLIGLICFYFSDNYSVKKDDIDNNDTKSVFQFIKEDGNKCVVVALLNVIQQFSMINGVIMYYDSVIKDNNSVKIDLTREIATILMSLVILFSNTIASFVISRLKNENYLNLFIFSQLLTGLSLIFLALKFETMLFTYIFLFSFSIGLGPLIWPFCSTLLKRKHLSVGIKLGNLINFISSIASLFIFGYSVKFVYRQYVFWLGAVIMIFSTVLLKFFLKSNKV